MDVTTGKGGFATQADMTSEAPNELSNAGSQATNTGELNETSNTGSSSATSTNQGNQSQGPAQVAASVTDTAQNLVGQTKETVGHLVGQTQQQAKSWTGSQLDQLASSIDTVAQVLRHTGDDLRDQDQQFVAQYTDKAAAQIERVSQYFHQTDADHIVREVEYFAVRQPALFLGGAFALGVLTARFLKSSSERARSWEMSNQSQSSSTNTSSPYGDSRQGTWTGSTAGVTGMAAPPDAPVASTPGSEWPLSPPLAGSGRQTASTAGVGSSSAVGSQ